MMTSAEIAQLMANQNNMFLGQRSYSQQIGIPSPDPFSRGGGGSQADGSWSYAPGGHFGASPGAGNAFAGNMMSAGRAAMTTAGMGLGIASMFGGMGRIAPFLDPISGGMAGFARAGLMGGVAGAALPLALGAGVSMAANAFVGGGQQQMMMTNQLGQFNFLNPNARGGQGFSREDAMSIGSSIRSLAHIPEMMTSVEELTKMLPRLKSMGVMQGVKDATEFSQRFRESIKTIRDVSKMLGTTMDEASEFFAHSRNVGFLGRQAQLQNTMNVQFTSGLTGMDVGQVMQLQQGGANMAMQMGARRSTGARATTNIAQQIAMAQRNGRLEEGALEDITGLEGPAAIQAASQRFAGMLSNIAQGSPAGRLSMFGMLKTDENGRVKIDDEFAQRYREGGVSMGELKQRASSLTRAQKISAMARMQDLAMDFAGKTGPQGIASFLEGVAGDRFGSEGVNLLLQRQGGATAGEADVMQGMIGGAMDDGLFKSQALNQAKEAAIRDRTDPHAIVRRLKTRMHSTLFGGLEESGAKVFTQIGKAYDEFIDDLVDRHVVRLSSEGAKAFEQAMASGSGKGELRKMFAAAHRAGGKDYSPTGPTMFEEAAAMGVGLAVGLPVGLMTGGVGGVATGLAAQQATKWGLVSLRTGDSELGAYLRKGAFDTGRSASFEQQVMNRQAGGAGNLGALDRGLEGQGEAAGVLRELQDSIPNFRNLSEAAKKDALVDAVNSLMNANGRSVQASSGNEDVQRANIMVRAGQAMQKSLGASGKGTDLATAAIAAAQTGMGGDSFRKISFAGIAGGGNISLDDAVRNADRAQKAAEDSLTKIGISAETIQTIRDRPDMRKAIQMGLGSNGELVAALESRDDARALKALSDRGVRLKPEELEDVRKAIADIRSKGGDAVFETMSAINTWSDAKKLGDVVAIAQRSADVSTDLHEGARTYKSQVDTSAVENLSAALGEFSKKPGEASFEGVRSRVGELTAAIQKEKDPIKRAALAKAAGQFGNLNMIERGERAVGKTMDPKGIAEALGYKYDDSIASALMDAGVVGGKQKVTKELIEQAEQGISKASAAGKIATKGATAIAGEKDQEIIKTLKQMQINASAQTEILGVIAAKATGEDAKGIVAHAVVVARENANKGSNGATSN